LLASGLQAESTLPKQHRFRALDVALAVSIEPFRTEQYVTLAEVACREQVCGQEMARSMRQNGPS
jgi:hypothetical protein